MSIRCWLLVPCSVAFLSVFAQDSLLTLDGAVDLALRNNFDIRIARNYRDQAANNSNAGNAGMLPFAGVNGAYSGTDGHVKQSLSSGAETDRDNARSTNASAGVALSWTVFDGLKMFATRQKLEELAAQGDQKLKVQIENTLSNVIGSYYNVVQQQQTVDAAEVQVTAAEEAVNITQRKLANGSGSKLELLLAKTDLNAQLSSELDAKAALDIAKVSLRQLLALEPSTVYSVEDTVVIDYDPTVDDLMVRAGKQNNTLLELEQQQRITALGLKEVQAERLPVIGLSGGYQYTRATSNASFLLLNQNLGTAWGITASVPIFNGFQLDTRIKNARLDLANSQLAMDQGRQALSADILNAHRRFQSLKGIMDLEEQNISDAHEVLNIALARFQAGVSTIIELKDAQSTFAAATSRLVLARYNTKVAETELRRLAGDLVK